MASVEEQIKHFEIDSDKLFAVKFTTVTKAVYTDITNNAFHALDGTTQNRRLFCHGNAKFLRWK